MVEPNPPEQGSPLAAPNSPQVPVGVPTPALPPDLPVSLPPHAARFVLGRFRLRLCSKALLMSFTRGGCATSRGREYLK
jgi:hypothetical protein